MNYVRLTAEQQRAVCEDLLAIEEAGLSSRLAEVRLRMLREMPSACVWEQVAIDRLTMQAASLVGGSRGYWRDAAAAALAIPSRADVSVEAIRQVADDAARWEEPPEEEPQQCVPRYRATLGSRKRGAR